MRLLHGFSVLVVTAFTVASDCKADEPEGSWITFLSHRTGRNLLYKMRPEGGEVTPIFGGELADIPGLTEGLTLYREPHWSRQSPDRKLFLSWATDIGLPREKYRSPSRFMIYLGRLEGGPTRAIAPDGEETFAWSPDSKRFAYYVQSVKSPHMPPGIAGKSPSSQIIVVGVDGSHQKVVLDRPGYWSVEDWSPDGKRLLLHFRPALSLRYGIEELIEFDLAAALGSQERTRGETEPPNGRGMDDFMTLLTGGQAADFSEGRYSPDGRQIATTFTRHLQTPGSSFDPKGFELGVLDVASGGLRPIAKYPEGLRGPICWSPDGKEILFSRYLAPDDRREKMEGGLGIWSIRPDGTNARFITTGWSADWR